MIQVVRQAPLSLACASQLPRGGSLPRPVLFDPKVPGKILRLHFVPLRMIPTYVGCFIAAAHIPHTVILSEAKNLSTEVSYLCGFRTAKVELHWIRAQIGVHPVDKKVRVIPFDVERYRAGQGSKD